MVTEELVYSKYFYMSMKPSIYAIGDLVEDKEKSYLFCPSCHRHHQDLRHGQEIKCACGLHMTRDGNCLKVWK